jgi:hypothetical protein
MFITVATELRYLTTHASGGKMAVNDEWISVWKEEYWVWNGVHSAS